MRSRPASASVSGQCPPPQPSTWNACQVRPAVTASVSSTESSSFMPSVCTASCTSWASATSSAQRSCSGPAPTSSWILSPPPPARSTSSTGPGRAEDARTSRQALSGCSSSAAQVAAQALLGVAAEVPDRPEVLHHERRQPAGERRVADLRREPVDVRVDAAGRRDQRAAVDHGRRRVEHDVDRVHRVGVARAADGDDAAVRDADARAPHAEHRIEQQDVGDREPDAAALGAHREAVAHRPAHARWRCRSTSSRSGSTSRPVSPSWTRGSGTEIAPLARQRQRRARARPDRRAGRRRARRGRARRAARRSARRTGRRSSRPRSRPSRPPRARAAARRPPRGRARAAG